MGHENFISIVCCGDEKCLRRIVIDSGEGFSFLHCTRSKNSSIVGESYSHNTQSVVQVNIDIDNKLDTIKGTKIVDKQEGELRCLSNRCSVVSENISR